MNGNGVNVRADDVKKLASALQKYEKQVMQAGKDFQKALESASWNDPQKARFASKFSDFQKKINGFVANDSKPMIKYLNEYARRASDMSGMRP